MAKRFGSLIFRCFEVLIHTIYVISKDASTTYYQSELSPDVLLI